MTLEEDLSELQRSYVLLTKGLQLQKRAVLVFVATSRCTRTCT